ncbi:MAG TPA: class I SAM-dependent methyltransferase [Pyrinomonadaceae bacterium]|nr:class I SAM-dependent methyltransferase [Pyrinomonadaceae bacterium]
MQTPKKIEDFAGQRILAEDPRSEKAIRACVACGSTEAQKLGVKNELQIVCCDSCGTIYTPYSPWYSSQYFYLGYYLKSEETETPPFVLKRLEEITADFAPYRQTNRLLDLGCGAGDLLEAARKNGWQAQGVDVAAHVVNHVRRRGFEVFEGELHEAALPSQHFDVVTAAELLEHIFEPRALVQEVARILRPGGLFWTTTPHARGLSARVLGLNWRCIWPPEHLQLFSIGGLTALLRGAGFRDIHVDTTGGNPVEIWHALGKTKSAPKTVDQHFDRVLTSYQLNESLMKSRSRRALKSTVNSFLNLSRLGDSLKVFAVR